MVGGKKTKSDWISIQLPKAIRMHVAFLELGGSTVNDNVRSQLNEHEIKRTLASGTQARSQWNSQISKEL